MVRGFLLLTIGLSSLEPTVDVLTHEHAVFAIAAKPKRNIGSAMDGFGYCAARLC